MGYQGAFLASIALYYEALCHGIMVLDSEMNKEGAKEFAQWRKSHDRWLKSLTVTPDELAATRKVAESHHVHEFSTEVGLTALFTTCACGFRHAIFKDWVQQPRRVMGR